MFKEKRSRSKSAKAKTTRKAKLKSGGAKKAPKPAMKKTRTPKVHAASKAPVPVPINVRRREPGGDSERGFYLRLGDEKVGPANKALVKAAAEKAGMSMNAYATAAVMFVVENGMPAAKHEEPAAATA